MVKTITRVGDSCGLVFDAALMQMTGLDVGDAVNVTVQRNGAITLFPVRPIVESTDAEVRPRAIVGNE